MNNTPQFHAHIEKRRMRCGHRWFCVTREHAGFGLTFDRHGEYGPFRLKREVKAVKETAKKSYVEARKGA